MDVVIVGLGYVGLPLACLCAKKGHQVSGVTIDGAAVELINRKESPIKDAHIEKALKNVDLQATTDFSVVKDAEIIILCVPTPVKKDHTPDLSPLQAATHSIIPHLKQGQLVIVESTVYPGTCEEVVKPIIDKSGMIAGEDIFLAHCPERVDPGNDKWTIENIPRVVGAISSKGLEKASKFYSTIVDASITSLSSLKAAEATKIMENSFRDINIAFMNEMAMSFDRAGIDVLEVVKGASSKPFGFMPHFPGCGVGGHCIPVDPYYLIEKAKSIGFDHKFLKLARRINNSMPEYTVDLLLKSLKDAGISQKNARIGILGLAYKPGVDDLRESPALIIRDSMSKQGLSVSTFDPYIPDKSTEASVAELLKNVDAVIMTTAHKEFLDITPEILEKADVKVIIDGRNCLDKNAFSGSSVIYKGIGR